MHITGTQFNYYQVCKRKLWLSSNGIWMEHTSDLVYEGKLIHETTYLKRPEQYEELALDGIKIDYYDARNRIVHEIKKSNKIERAHIWQAKYYIYVLEQNGVEGVSGIIEYPMLRKTREVELNDEDRKSIEQMKEEILSLISLPICPPVLGSKICKSCSYYDFCYVTEGVI